MSLQPIPVLANHFVLAARRVHHVKSLRITSTRFSQRVAQAHQSLQELAELKAQEDFDQAAVADYLRNHIQECERNAEELEEEYHEVLEEIQFRLDALQDAKDDYLEAADRDREALELLERGER